MRKLTTTTTAHGTIVRALAARDGGYYWQAHRDVLGTGETTRTSMLASGTTDTLEAAMAAGEAITLDYRPPMATALAWG